MQIPGRNAGKAGTAHQNGAQCGKQDAAEANTSAKTLGNTTRKVKGMSKVTVTFAQKVSEAPYETADYSLMIEQEFDELSDPVQIANDLFAQVKSEVLKQAGCEYDLSQDGLVMRRLQTSVRGSSAPQASAPAATAPSVPTGPTANSVAQSSTSAPTPSGAKMTGRVYPRTEFSVGKDADKKQLAFNILAFHPAEWDGGVKAYQVKEKADGTTDTTPKGTNYPNFSISTTALGMAGVNVERDMGVWINEGDSNVPLKVWDALNGQTQADAVEWDWTTRRQELQAFAYKKV